MQDIFDRLTEELDDPKTDVFDELEAEDSAVENVKDQVTALLEKFDAKDRKNENRKFSDEMKDFIREEIAKIKPKQNVIEKTIKTVVEPRYIEPKIVEAPPQIIKEVRVEVQTEKKDTTKYVEESKYLDLLVKIAKLEGQIRETKKMAEQPIFMPGGPGVIGIPAPEPNPDGYVLTVKQGKAKWVVNTATGGGSSSDAYTPTNVTTDRSFDANDVSIDELADVLGSLIVSLQGAGIIQ